MWRSTRLTNLIRELDERREESLRNKGKSSLRKERVMAESPMKRKPSNRVPLGLLCENDEECEEDVGQRDDTVEVAMKKQKRARMKMRMMN